MINRLQSYKSHSNLWCYHCEQDMSDIYLDIEKLLYNGEIETFSYDKKIEKRFYLCEKCLNKFGPKNLFKLYNNIYENRNWCNHNKSHTGNRRYCLTFNDGLRVSFLFLCKKCYVNMVGKYYLFEE